ncbi:MAG TPA: hypothetical protein DHV36_08935 [Desulfobacteraceae bacterium]|nr:hypothetical protein [Desulfobacteraceae bacterium]
MKRLILICLVLTVLAVFYGCGKMEPAAYHPVDEVPQGPGLFTGKKGAVDIIGLPDESSDDN